MSEACGCSRPVRAGYRLCDTCRKTLEQHFAEMRWLDGQLDISLTRVKGIDYRGASTSRSAEKPLPWNERAAITRANLKNELVGWVRILHTTGGLPNDRFPDLAAWLLKHLEPIAKRDDAWVVFEGIDKACFEARAIVFAKPTPRFFIGPCEGSIHDEDDEIREETCTGEIFATEGSNLAECDLCCRTYDAWAATKARDKILADYDFTASEIASAAHRGLGQPRERVENLLNTWIKRKRILARGHHQHGEICHRRAAQTNRPCALNGQATYNYGDVLDMLRVAYDQSA